MATGHNVVYIALRRYQYECRELNHISTGGDHWVTSPVITKDVCSMKPSECELFLQEMSPSFDNGLWLTEINISMCKGRKLLGVPGGVLIRGVIARRRRN